MRLNVKAFALTCGIIWALCLLACTWWMILFDGATGEVTWLGRLYRGYNVSPTGSLVGLAWALPDGLVDGAIFAWLYNLLLGKVSK